MESVYVCTVDYARLLMAPRNFLEVDSGRDAAQASSSCTLPRLSEP